MNKFMLGAIVFIVIIPISYFIGGAITEYSMGNDTVLVHDTIKIHDTIIYSDTMGNGMIMDGEFLPNPG